MGRDENWTPIETIEDDWYDGPIFRAVAERSASGEVRVEVSVAAHFAEDGWCSVSLGRADFQRYIDAIDKHAGAVALPVLRQCGSCAWCGPTSGGWSCDHPTSVAAVQAEQPGCPQGGHVDHDAAPPAWCPLRLPATPAPAEGE